MAPAAIIAAKNTPPAAGAFATAPATTTGGVDVVVGRPDALALLVGVGTRDVASVDGTTMPDVGYAGGTYVDWEGTGRYVD